MDGDQETTDEKDPRDSAAQIRGGPVAPRDRPRANDRRGDGVVLRPTGAPSGPGLAASGRARRGELGEPALRYPRWACGSAPAAGRGAHPPGAQARRRDPAPAVDGVPRDPPRGLSLQPVLRDLPALAEEARIRPCASATGPGRRSFVDYSGKTTPHRGPRHRRGRSPSSSSWAVWAPRATSYAEASRAARDWTRGSPRTRGCWRTFAARPRSGSPTI